MVNSIDYKNKYLKYKNKYLKLKGGAYGKTFRIYTTGIANWSISDSLIPHWINGFYENIIRNIPPEYTKIEICHYAYLTNMHGSVKSPEEIREYDDQFGELSASDMRDPRVVSIVKIEPFNHSNLAEIDLSRDCLIVDMAHLYSHPHETQGFVIPMQVYLNQADWVDVPIRMNVLRFGYAKTGYLNQIASNCKLFNVNPDGSITTFVDIMREMHVDFPINEPIDIFSNMIDGEKTTDSRFIISKVIETLSGKKFFEIEERLKRIFEDRTHICLIFDMLFDKIPINIIKFEYIKILLEKHFSHYRPIIQGADFDIVIETIRQIFAERGLELDDGGGGVVAPISQFNRFEALDQDKRVLFQDLVTSGIMSEEDAYRLVNN